MPWREFTVAVSVVFVWNLWKLPNIHPFVLATALAVFLGFCFSQCGRLRQMGFEYIAWDWPGRRWCCCGLLAGAVVIVCTGLLYQAAQQAAPISIPGPTTGGGIPATTILMLLTFVPLVEECIFRGYLFRMVLALGGAVSSRWAPFIAVIGTAILFAAAHSAGAWSGGQILRSATTLITGIVFAVLRHRSASTVPGVLAHAVYNAGIVLLAVTLDAGN